LPSDTVDGFADFRAIRMVSVSRRCVQVIESFASIDKDWRVTDYSAVSTSPSLSLLLHFNQLQGVD